MHHKRLAMHNIGTKRLHYLKELTEKYVTKMTLHLVKTGIVFLVI